MGQQIYHSHGSTARPGAVERAIPRLEQRQGHKKPPVCKAQLSIPTAEAAGMAAKPAEQSKSLPELLRLVWVSLLAVGGSAISLPLGNPMLLWFGLAGAGLLVTLLLALVIWQLHRRIQALIAQL